jgi:GT2 family glycosyltransferase
MDLSIIIVNYRSRDKLMNCLAALRRAEIGGLKYEIIVVDNNSGDDLSEVGRQYPDIRLIMSPVNRGMGAGNNLGVKAAAGEFVFILNPDTAIRGRAITDLLNYLKGRPAVGLVGPKLLYPDGSLQMSCSRFPSFFMPILRRTFLGDYFKASRDSFIMSDFNHNSLRSVDWLMGSCLMFRKEITLPDGQIFAPSFDERYFMYFEDIDLARQFWTRGLQVVYNPEAVVEHDHRRESARHPWYLAIFLDAITWHHIASWLKYFIKWGFKTKNYAQN